MKVTCVGTDAAGLYLGILLKRKNPSKRFCPLMTQSRNRSMSALRSLLGSRVTYSAGAGCSACSSATRQRSAIRIEAIRPNKA